MKKVLFVPLVFSLVFILGTAFLAPPAYASVYPYDGTNPDTTGTPLCDSNAVTVYSLTFHLYPDSSGLLELRFSNVCATAWARFTCNQGFCNNYSLYIHRNNDGVEERVDVSSGTPQGVHVYTLQLDDSGSLSSKACIDRVYPRGSSCTNSF